MWEFVGLLYLDFLYQAAAVSALMDVSRQIQYDQWGGLSEVMTALDFTELVKNNFTCNLLIAY